MSRNFKYQNTNLNKKLFFEGEGIYPKDFEGVSNFFVPNFYEFFEKHYQNNVEREKQFSSDEILKKIKFKLYDDTIKRRKRN